MRNERKEVVTRNFIRLLLAITGGIFCVSIEPCVSLHKYDFRELAHRKSYLCNDTYGESRDSEQSAIASLSARL